MNKASVFECLRAVMIQCSENVMLKLSKDFIHVTCTVDWLQKFLCFILSMYFSFSLFVMLISGLCIVKCNIWAWYSKYGFWEKDIEQ